MALVYTSQKGSVAFIIPPDSRDSIIKRGEMDVYDDDDEEGKNRTNEGETYSISILDMGKMNNETKRIERKNMIS